MASNLLATASNLRAMASNIIANRNACASFKAQCWSYGYFVQACWSFWPFDTGRHDFFRAMPLAHVFLPSGYVFLCPQGSKLMSRSAVGRRLFGSTAQKTMLTQYKTPPAIGAACAMQEGKNQNAVKPRCELIRFFIHIRGPSFNPPQTCFSS